MEDKTVNINNFIGVYDNYITLEECNKAIRLYEEQNKFDHTVNRIGGQNRSIIEMQDQQFFASAGNVEIKSASTGNIEINIEPELG